MERKASKFSPPEEVVGKKERKPVGTTLEEVKDTVQDAVPEDKQADFKAKPKRKAKAKGEPTVRRSKFKEMFPDEQTITLLVTENPKKKGSQSAERFEGYTGAATVGEALAKGVKYADIAYDLGRQYIKLG